MNKLTVNINPELPERFETLRQFVAFRSGVVPKYSKVQAADMDMAPSTLSRKLNPTEGDTQRFNVDDLEAWLRSTGDAQAVVEYLAAKYLHIDEFRLAAEIERLQKLNDEVAQVLVELRRAGK